MWLSSRFAFGKYLKLTNAKATKIINPVMLYLNEIIVVPMLTSVINKLTKKTNAARAKVPIANQVIHKRSQTDFNAFVLISRYVAYPISPIMRISFRIQIRDQNVPFRPIPKLTNVCKKNWSKRPKKNIFVIRISVSFDVNLAIQQHNK